MSPPPATTPDLDLDDEFAYKRSPVQRLQIFLHRYPWMSSLVVLIGVILVFALVNERFLLPATVSLMLQQTVIVGTLAIAQTLIILTAGIDLSIGAIMIFGQMVMANFAVYTTASNVSMLMLLETVLGPLWVWMIIDERPSHLTIAGGAIVILSIFYFLLSERKNTTPV